MRHYAGSGPDSFFFHALGALSSHVESPAPLMETQLGRPTESERP